MARRDKYGRERDETHAGEDGATMVRQQRELCVEGHGRSEKVLIARSVGHRAGGEGKSTEFNIPHGTIRKDRSLDRGKELWENGLSF